MQCSGKIPILDICLISFLRVALNGIPGRTGQAAQGPVVADCLDAADIAETELDVLAKATKKKSAKQIVVLHGINGAHGQLVMLNVTAASARENDHAKMESPVSEDALENTM